MRRDCEPNDWIRADFRLPGPTHATFRIMQWTLRKNRLSAHSPLQYYYEDRNNSARARRRKAACPLFSKSIYDWAAGSIWGAIGAPVGTPVIMREAVMPAV
jgi:hypothetical protein